jgi:hypothetical protein
MQISWDDVNRTERPGLHFVTRLGLDIFVTQRAIEDWQRDPTGCHHVVEISTGWRKIYSVGTFGPCQED